MSTSYRRTAGTRNDQFRAPLFDCLACNDTGVLVNGDGQLWRYIEDYKPATDLALICWCKAAYGAMGIEGRATRGSYREDSGQIRRTEEGQPIGAELPKHVTRELHQSRRDSWVATSSTMNAARTNLRAGITAMPAFIAEARASLRVHAPAGVGTLQSLGQIISDSPQLATAQTDQPPAGTAPPLPEPRDRTSLCGVDHDGNRADQAHGQGSGGDRVLPPAVGAAGNPGAYSTGGFSTDPSENDWF